MKTTLPLILILRRWWLLREAREYWRNLQDLRRVAKRGGWHLVLKAYDFEGNYRNSRQLAKGLTKNE
ncbi:hypothetical protein HB991_13390 [Yersinia mollaretii]|uniref:Uncharacterized protein n=1 Tax=Yersinia mollaretii TaxID=33060 RepID=A0AA44CMQ4_YERMO|nr:hypothetical protein [Yersinia mollaretii]NIL23499.1 hypothetical protein [Yersinia mollaretii]